MKSRREIKDLGRSAFLARYWPCVGTLVVLSLILFALGAFSYGAVSLIITGPLSIGACFFFINIFVGNPSVNVGTMFEKGFENFGRKLGGYLWMVLFLFLWGLLLFAFVIPGVVMLIIKKLEYSMCPYILSDCPNVRAQDALTLSKRMMKGRKWKLLVFFLSYIGWYLLCLVPPCIALVLLVSHVGSWAFPAKAFLHTFSPWILASVAGRYLLFWLIAFAGQLLDIFYIGPWISSAKAGWYLELREECLRTGVITPSELEGGPLMG